MISVSKTKDAFTRLLHLIVDLHLRLQRAQLERHQNVLISTMGWNDRL